MKPILLAALLFLLPKLAFSQIPDITDNDKVICLDSSYLPTKPVYSRFYRIIKDYKLNKANYTILEYSRSGTLQTKFFSNPKNNFTQQDEVTYYYENGNIKSVINYTQGRPNGKDLEWYENGNKKLEAIYITDEEKGTTQHKINQFWDINGIQKVINGEGDYDENIYKTLNFLNTFGSGKIKNGFKDSIWQGWIGSPETKYAENYKKGKFISGKIVDKNNIERNYDILEKRPLPKRGVQDFYNYIGRNLKLPNEVTQNKINGVILVAFIVDKDGKIVEPKILKPMGYGLDEEVIGVITNYENWFPGQQRGINVRTLYTLPVTIMP